MSITTIVLADDHPIVTQGLRFLIESQSGLRIVGETDDGLEAVRLVERFKPTVLVTDLMMPGLTGLEVARQVRERIPATRVLILSMYSKEAYILEALKNGVSGFVLKDSVGTELLHAITEVAAGRRYLSRALSDRAIDAYVENAKALPTNSYDELTGREREVLKLAADGNSNLQIGNQLSISPRTAETHRSHLMKKLGLQSQTDLIRFALSRGVISGE